MIKIYLLAKSVLNSTDDKYIGINMKTCFKCKTEKPYSEFYKHAQMKDGHLNKCKLCTKKDVFIYRHESQSREKVLEYDRKRGSRHPPEYMQRYRSIFPNKRKAHNMVSNAIRDRKLFKEPCEVCCAKIRIHAHHDDYAKPLNVRWLCAAHHRQWHAKHGEGMNP